MAVDSPHFAIQQIFKFGGGIVERIITNLFIRWAEVSFEFGFLTLHKLTIFGGNLVWNSSVVSPCFRIRNLEISKGTVFFDVFLRYLWLYQHFGLHRLDVVMAISSCGCLQSLWRYQIVRSLRVLLPYRFPWEVGLVRQEWSIRSNTETIASLIIFCRSSSIGL